MIVHKTQRKKANETLDQIKNLNELDAKGLEGYDLTKIPYKLRNARLRRIRKVSQALDVLKSYINGASPYDY